MNIIQAEAFDGRLCGSEGCRQVWKLGWGHGVICIVLLNSFCMTRINITELMLEFEIFPGGIWGPMALGLK